MALQLLLQVCCFTALNKDEEQQHRRLHKAVFLFCFTSAANTHIKKTQYTDDMPQSRLKVRTIKPQPVHAHLSNVNVTR